MSIGARKMFNRVIGLFGSIQHFFFDNLTMKNPKILIYLLLTESFTFKSELRRDGILLQFESLLPI